MLRTLASVAGVTLTSRDAKSDHPVPLAGVPYHALDTYLTRCLEAGLTVAICEQVEDPALAKGLVKREVVEIISPGTATSEELVNTKAGHFCLAWVPSDRGEQGWALLDASTGEFRCGQETASLASLCQRHPVREVVVREGTEAATLQAWRSALPEVVINTANDAWFHPSFARRTLLDHFEVANLTAFGLEDTDRGPATTAAGSVLRYLQSMTLKRPAQVTHPALPGAGRPPGAGRGNSAQPGSLPHLPGRERPGHSGPPRGPDPDSHGAARSGESSGRGPDRPG